jgi:hypothetical protein
MGVSADGYVSTDDGVPALAIMPGFESGVSPGFPEFIQGCDAVVMGRNTFVPALGAPQWPWPGPQGPAVARPGGGFHAAAAAALGPDLPRRVGRAGL